MLKEDFGISMSNLLGTLQKIKVTTTRSYKKGLINQATLNPIKKFHAGFGSEKNVLLYTKSFFVKKTTCLPVTLEHLKGIFIAFKHVESLVSASLILATFIF